MTKSGGLVLSLACNMMLVISMLADREIRFFLPLPKIFVPLFESLAKATVRSEKGVNKLTQYSKNCVGKVATNPEMQQNVKYGVTRTASRYTFAICTLCYGRGSLQGRDGHSHRCDVCHETGKTNYEVTAYSLDKR